MRGDIYRLTTDPHARAHEQQGARYAVVVQSEALLTSTLIAVPTSPSARAAAHRPEIRIGKQRTRVLTEQIQAVDPRSGSAPTWDDSIESRPLTSKRHCAWCSDCSEPPSPRWWSSLCSCTSTTEHINGRVAVSPEPEITPGSG